MSLGHLTLPTQDVKGTAGFLERMLGLPRLPVPPNSPIEAIWLDIGRGQAIHIFYAEGFATSPHEGEFGRHIALYHPLGDFAALKSRLEAEGVKPYPPERATPFERFFFREPVNGYVFEVVDDAQAGAGAREDNL